MNTIRQLCDRVIVLKSGNIIFDGDVTKGIEFYIGSHKPESDYFYDESFHKVWKNRVMSIVSSSIYDNSDIGYAIGSVIKGEITIESSVPCKKIKLRIELTNALGIKIGTSISDEIFIKQIGKNTIFFGLDTFNLVPEQYFANLIIFEYDEVGHESGIDGVYPGFVFSMIEKNRDIVWDSKNWGFVKLPNIVVALKDDYLK